MHLEVCVCVCMNVFVDIYQQLKNNKLQIENNVIYRSDWRGQGMWMM